MHDNPIRGRLNAWFLTLLDGYMHGKYAAVKSRLLEGHPPTVVELGSGAGANMRYLPRGTHLIAVEPNVHMHAPLQRKADAHGINLEIRGLAGEALDLPANSVDFVFASLVLCTVSDPKQVVAEVHRVLRPGGKFVCVEHVEAPQGSLNRRLQYLLRRPWRYLFEGCDLCRNTGATLHGAGFSKVEVDPLLFRSIVAPIRHQITAVCVK